MLLRINPFFVLKVFQKILSEKLSNILITFVMIYNVLLYKVDFLFLLLTMFFSFLLLFLPFFNVLLDLVLLVILHENTLAYKSDALI